MCVKTFSIEEICGLLEQVNKSEAEARELYHNILHIIQTTEELSDSFVEKATRIIKENIAQELNHSIDTAELIEDLCNIKPADEQIMEEVKKEINMLDIGILDDVKLNNPE